jgi:hypothetical protein
MMAMVYVPESQASRRVPSFLFRPQNTATCPVFPVAAAGAARKVAAERAARRSRREAGRRCEGAITIS